MLKRLMKINTDILRTDITHSARMFTNSYNICVHANNTTIMTTVATYIDSQDNGFCLRLKDLGFNAHNKAHYLLNCDYFSVKHLFKIF